MPWAEITGGRLHYRIDGSDDAPVLLLSHSVGTDLSLWHPQIAALSPTFRIVRYDSRGHGQSLVTPGPYTIQQLASDAAELLDHLGIACAHFCGLSLGGMVGMWLADSMPERVDRLVLANTSARLGPPEYWDTRISFVRQNGLGAVADQVMERWLSATFRRQQPADTLAVQSMLLAAPPDGYCACCAAIRDMDQRGRLASIQAPTLVIAGTHDPSTPPAMGHVIADSVPRARYVELPAAHLSNVEAAGAFNDLLADFLLA